MMIQMPYGGDKTVSSFFKNNRYSPATFNFYEFGKHIIEAIALGNSKRCNTSRPSLLQIYYLIHPMYHVLLILAYVI
jgi:hypothetical protein